MNEHASEPEIADSRPSTVDREPSLRPIPAQQVNLQSVFLWGTVAWAGVFAFSLVMGFVDESWVGATLKLPWVSGVGIVVGLLSLMWLRRSRQVGGGRP